MASTSHYRHSIPICVGRYILIVRLGCETSTISEKVVLPYLQSWAKTLLCVHPVSVWLEQTLHPGKRCRIHATPANTARRNLKVTTISKNNDMPLLPAHARHKYGVIEMSGILCRTRRIWKSHHELLGCALPLGHGHPTPFGRPAEPKRGRGIGMKFHKLCVIYPSPASATLNLTASFLETDLLRAQTKSDQPKHTWNKFVSGCRV